MDINKIIAENLKKLRTERNLSLGQLSLLSDISKVMLSQIEKGDTNPTINTIWKIANGLKIPYTSLLEQQKHESCIIKKENTDFQAVEDGHYRLYCYYPNTPNRNFELFQIELDASSSYTSVGHSEKSMEYILVITGKLSLTVNDKTFCLTANDAIDFTASEIHTYQNIGQETVTAVVLNYYPV